MNREENLTPSMFSGPNHVCIYAPKVNENKSPFNSHLSMYEKELYVCVKIKSELSGNLSSMLDWLSIQW